MAQAQAQDPQPVVFPLVIPSKAVVRALVSDIVEAEGREIGFLKVGGEQQNNMGMITYAWDLNRNCYSE